MAYTSNVSNGIVNSKAVNEGDVLNVYNTGVASNTSVVRGSLSVYNNGVIENTTVDKNGIITITDGGNAYNTNIIAGTLYTSNGSNNYVENTTVTFGAIDAQDGRIVSTTLNEGGTLFVASNAVTSNTIINSAGDMYVSSTGSAYNTTINDGGIMVISSTGVAYNTTVSNNTSGSTPAVLSVNGGVASDTSVVRGNLSVFNNGVIENTTVDLNGVITITNGGSAYNTNIKAGVIYVSNGSNNYLENTTITYGTILASDGQLVSTTLNKGGYLAIASNAVINNTIVNSSGTLKVSNGATAFDTSIVSGNLSVYNNGVIENTTVDKNGIITITDGGNAYNTNIIAGTLYTSNGSNNYVENTTVTFGAIDAQDGRIVSTTLNNGGTLYVTSNAVTSNTIINSGGDMSVFSGGNAYNTTVSDNGIMFVSSAGSTYNTTISDGGIMVVSSAGSTYNTTVSNNISVSNPAVLSVNGGVASDTLVFRGNLSVFNNGVIENTTVESNGIITITDNGNAYNTNILGGELRTSNGSNNYVENTTVTFGAIDAQDGRIVGTTLNNGGTLFVASNAVASNTIINSAGDMYVSSTGSTYNTTINDGGIMVVSSTGVAYNTTVSNNTSGSTPAILSVNGGVASDTSVVLGNLSVFNNGVIENTTVDNNGAIYITNGGSAYNTNIKAGVIYVSSGSNNYLENTTVTYGTILASDGQLVSTTLNEGGYLAIASNAVINNTIVNSSGTLKVSNGATAFDTSVVSGNLSVYNNGVIENTTVDKNGIITITDGGNAYNTNIIAGTLYTSNGSNNYVENTTVTFGAIDAQDGRIVSTTLNNGGTLYVTSNAVTSNTIINSGGDMSVFSGGNAYNTTVNDGGIMVISSAGSTYNTTVSNGGIFQINSGGHLSGIATIDNGGSAVIWYGAGGSANLIGNNTQLVITGLGNGGTLTTTINIPTEIDNFNGQGAGNSDAIILDGITQDDVVNVAYEDANGNGNPNYVTLTLSNGSKITMNIIGAQDAGYNLSSSDGKLIYEVCFLSGSLIKTINGDVKVEDLRVNDKVVTYDWKNNTEVIQNIKWVGHKHATVNTNLPDDMAGYPVRIQKGAIAENVPYKDLLVTPEHCLFFDNKFVPARMLVNNHNIFYDYSLTSYTYYHVEAETHSVIWADGMLTESYLDTGNRHTFHNPENNIVLFPRQQDAKTWEADGCAPLVTDHHHIEPLFKQLLNRAQELGIQKRIDDLVLDNDPHLYIQTQDGQIIYPHAENKGRFVFNIPSNIDNVRLISQNSRPYDTVGPFMDDRRQLGVLIGNISILSQNEVHNINEHLSHDHLDGWHDIESHLYRWTDGNAYLPLGNRDNIEQNKLSRNILIVHVVAGGPYVSLTQENLQKIA